MKEDGVPRKETSGPGRFRAWLKDARWSEYSGASPGRKIALTTFGILALELALIRWTSSQVRVFAYFNNLVLIGAFLGMGLGVALGRRRPGLVHFVLPLLAVVGLPLAFSEMLGLVHLGFPDPAISLWGGGWLGTNASIFLRSLAVFLALFTGIVAIFVCAGAPLGYLFSRLPPLRAYTADLWGSLLGVVAFAIAAWTRAGPLTWLALGALPFVWLARTYVAAGFGVLVLALAQFSVQGALFSAYNRIDLEREPLYLTLQVNRDFHQYLHDFSAARLADPSLKQGDREMLRDVRDLYDLPFVVNPQRGTALVVGAGTGNDVQAALRSGYREVTSVDIDGRILAIGRELHPEHPYARSEVRIVEDDARAFFGRGQGKYDVVCFGLLDSHAMASAMSTLRLDNYVYTEEGIRAAWRHVGEHGHLSLAISCYAGQWFFDRMYWTITAATGREPTAFYSPLHSAATFLVASDGVRLDLAQLASRRRLLARASREQTLTPNDDWPFLYVRPGVFPWGYVAVLAFVLGLAAVAIPPAFGFRRSEDRFDWPLFLMGAGFLLIETRGVTSMSLLFGSTWMVNAAVFGGILVMVLLGNLVVRRWELVNPERWFPMLFVAVALVVWFPVAWLETLPLIGRGVLAGIITGLPIGIAGLIVPMLLARSADPAASLGANLLGAVLGGCLEYYSMYAGLRATALMALAFYLVAYLAMRRRKATAPAAAGLVELRELP